MSIGKGILIGLLALVFFITLGVGIWYLRLRLLKPEYQLRRQAVKQSLQYTEGKVSQLMQMAEEWLKLDTEIAEATDNKVKNTKRSQQYYLEQRMRLEAERIDSKEVPRIVKEIMEGKK